MSMAARPMAPAPAIGAAVLIAKAEEEDEFGEEAPLVAALEALTEALEALLARDEDAELRAAEAELLALDKAEAPEDEADEAADEPEAAALVEVPLDEVPVVVVAVTVEVEVPPVVPVEPPEDDPAF